MNPQIDPASLERLHDIVLPAAAPWWPLAPAWYALAVLVAVFCAGLILSLVIRWRRNAYRRAGLAELDALQSRAADPQTARSLAELVKRVALTVYPRERVASLTGSAWLSFLDASANTTDFTRGAGTQLEAGYEPGEHSPSPETFRTVRYWILHHRADFV